MIIFLYGQDTYRSRQKLNEIKNKAKELVVVDNFVDLKKAQGTRSLFGQRKVIVIDCRGVACNAPLDEFAEIEDSDDIIVFWDEKPDKRSKIFKKLLKIAQCEEFNPLNHWQMVNWIKQHCRIEPRTAEKLALAVGNDLWRMENEINKLVCYIGDKYPISDTEVDMLIKPKISTDIFRTIKAMARGETKQVLQLLYQHIAQGDDQWFIFNMLIWQFRDSIKKLADKAARGLPPGLSACPRAGLRINRGKQWSNLKPFFEYLLQIDFWAKTGKIEQPALSFALLSSS